MRTKLYWTADGKSIVVALRALEHFVQVPTAPLQEFARYTKQQHINAFQGRYDPATGKPWKPLAASTIAQKKVRGTRRKGKGILSTLFVDVQRNGIVVGYRSPIAAIQHSGAKIRPYRIVPKNKQALYWAGATHPVRVVNHPGAVIPARPLVGFSPIDVAVFNRLVNAGIFHAWND